MSILSSTSVEELMERFGMPLTVAKAAQVNAPPTPAGKYITQDSGQREEFPSGAKRDTQNDKPRFDLIPVKPLKRLAELYARGAEKYGEFNWQKGMPFQRVVASLLRHIYAYLEGEDTEDHLAAVAWNAFTLMSYEEMIGEGKLSNDLNNLKG